MPASSSIYCCVVRISLLRDFCRGKFTPMTELQPLHFTDSVPNSMTAELPNYLIAGNTVQPNSITLQSRTAPEEIIRLDSKGFHYRDQLIEDAGEAHRLMVEFLKQNTRPDPKPPNLKEQALDQLDHIPTHDNEGRTVGVDVSIIRRALEAL